MLWRAGHPANRSAIALDTAPVPEPSRLASAVAPAFACCHCGNHASGSKWFPPKPKNLNGTESSPSVKINLMDGTPSKTVLTVLTVFDLVVSCITSDVMPLTARGRSERRVFGSIRFFAWDLLGARKRLGLLASRVVVRVGSVAVVPARADHGRHEQK